MKELGFIPADVAQRMRATVPGFLAEMLGQLAYDGHAEMVVTASGPDKVQRFVSPVDIYAPTPPEKRPFRLSPALKEKNNVDVRRLLTEVREYLEACALREVVR